jgi:hypothetical protein
LISFWNTQLHERDESLAEVESLSLAFPLEATLLVYESISLQDIAV